MTFEEWYTTFCKSWEDQLKFDAMDVYDAMKIAFNAAKEDSKPCVKAVFDSKWFLTGDCPFGLFFSSKEKAIEWAIENGYRVEES